MNKKWTWHPSLVLIFVLLGVASMVSRFTYAQEDHNQKAILVLNAYTPDNIWTKAENAGFEQRMVNDHEDVVYYYEYMATKKFSEAAYYEAFKNMLKAKYGKTKLDCVVATDDDAVAFLAQHRSEIFNWEIPVVYCGVNSLMNLPKRFWGIQEKASLMELITLIRKIHGEERKIVIFTDLTTASASSLNDLYNRSGAEFRKNIVVVGENRTAVAQRYLSDLKDCTLIFLLFNRDAQGKTYSYLEGYELFQKVIKVPTYSTWDFYMGHGIVGGIFTSPMEQGAKAAELAISVLNAHEKIDEHKLEKQAEALNHLDNKAQFDYPQLLAWGISRNELPEDAQIVNEPISYFEQNKKIILIAFSIIVALMGVILYMIRVIHLKNRYQAELSHSHQELEAINDHLEILVEQKVNELEKSYLKLKDAEVKLMQKEKVESMLNLSLQTAHDLNTPIGSSITLITFIKKEALRFKERVVRYEGAESLSTLTYDFLETLMESIEMIETSLSRVASYIKGIKERIESVEVVEPSVQTSFDNLEELIYLVWHDVPKGTPITLSCEGPEVKLARHEVAVLTKVLRVLMDNTVRHGYEVNQSESAPKIEIKWQVEQKQFNLVYKDYGTGISGERVRHLFTPLYKEDLSTVNSGFGLYSAQKLVERELNGTFLYDGNESCGAQFVLLFEREV